MVFRVSILIAGWSFNAREMVDGAHLNFLAISLMETELFKISVYWYYLKYIIFLREKSFSSLKAVKV